MKYHIKCILQKLIVVFLLPFRLCPIKQGQILFLSLEGGSTFEYSCNPKYICEYFLTNPCDKHQLVWLFRHPENYSFLEEQGIKTGKHFTLKGFYYALTSQFVITNGGYLTWFPFRKQQTVINTWHGGGAYKKLENDMKGANKASASRMMHSANHTSLFLSSSKLFTDFVIRGAFGYQGDILSCGMPRNDCLLTDSDKVIQRSKVLKRLQLPDTTKIVLYTPTFRGENATDFQPLQADRILSLLQEQDGKDWQLLYRTHVQSHNSSQIVGTDNSCIDVSSYPDTQELLCAADMLITDYSSIIWDYCLTDKPLFLYTPDFESYTLDRGFYLDMKEWGYPLCLTMDNLLEQIENVLTEKTFFNSKTHKELLGSLETGKAAEAVYNYITQKGQE